MIDAAAHANSSEHTYPLDAPIRDKVQAIATRVYGADNVHFLPVAEQKIARFAEQGLGELPICMAKTHLSLSDDPTLLIAPTGFTVHVRDVRAYMAPAGSSRLAARS